MTSFETLRSLARKPAPRERCDMCGAALAHEHQHLLDPAAQKLVCACDACAVLFYGNGETKYKRVPRRVRALPNFQLSEAEWDSLLIPIGLAYFVDSSAHNKILAYYPSPAGATESALSLEAWCELVQENPALALMEPDVEALLVNRVDHAAEYYVAPIDKCYQLVVLIRSNWRGLSGGTEVWQSIGDFFTTLKATANA